MNPPIVTPTDLRNLIVGPNELALIDLREGGIFSKRHLLFAISCPLSRLEILIEDLVPLKTIKLVLCASAIDSNMTTTGALRLAKLGYSDVSILEGGIEGWGAHGYELFSGVNVPSKAFGEFIETTYKTPHVQAHDIERMKKDGEDFIILDSRPYSEYHAMNIPGGIDVPGAELAYRIHDLAPNSKTKIVINCAGRTRSIIGAQSLINAGIPNPIMAVENGTMGWHLAGLKLERGQSRRFGDISPNAHLIALERAEAVRHRFDLKLVNEKTALAWMHDTSRSTFYLDVRDPSEFNTAHWPGAKSAPGGQLVQATDEYVGVRRARLVLIDNDGVRATMTASWLTQIGWRDVYIMAGANASFKRPEIIAPLKLDPSTPSILVDELAHKLDAGTCIVIDMANSLQYRDEGHIPGSWFAVRSNMPENISKIPETPLLVLTSPVGGSSQIVLEDAAKSGRDVKVLEGGTAAWKFQGHPLEYGFTHMADDPIDLWYKPYEFDDDDKNIEQAMEQYLTWEVDLVGQIERDGTTEFKIFK
jgi:rhodanese-related sulfurtransferase